MAPNNYKIQTDTPKKSTSSKSFILDQRIKITIGLLLQGITIFLAFSFLAHLIHGAKDQHLIESIGRLGLKPSNLATGNWLGFTGVFFKLLLCPYMVGYHCFYFFALSIFNRYKNGHTKNLSKPFFIKIDNGLHFLVLWFNILLGYLYTLCPTATLLANHLGGIGYTLGTLFKSLLGYGTFIFLLVTLVIFAVICFNITSLPNINLCSSKKSKHNATCLIDEESNRIVGKTPDTESEVSSSKKKRVI
ncbi:hypothetical protein [Cardinium endosymbiont of Bemisia tabaci]|uniref:hypothetical protein n=1 Tax=Cardinium endosymbiont of Bemisia tabaci TaxID=672794 RepID=UPI00054E2DA8|nr:hypothetical protein [Cardinium endosymbiont of Bemisia tabaci]